MAEINVGQISEALNNKADLDLNNTNPFADYVVEWQAPTAANDYYWYRLYKSGWVEQGGVRTVSNNSSVTITLPKQMRDAYYTCLITRTNNVVDDSSTPSTMHITTVNKTTTTFILRTYANLPTSWYVCGMSAQS